MNDDRSADQPPRSPGFWQTVASVLAAFFGVQSSTNRKRDFSRGKPLPFIIIGIVMTVLFVGALLLIVRFVLAQAGASH